MTDLPNPLETYLSNFHQEDEILRWIQDEARRHDLPAISLKAEEGKFLHLLVRASGARKVLEIGALGGYSGTWLARALPQDGRLWTLEVSPEHAAVARAAYQKAGLSERVTLVEGAALDTLPSLAAEAPFDFIFFDADTENYVNYLAWAGSSLRPGGILTAHNALVEGKIASPVDARSQGMADFQELLRADSRFDSMIIAYGDGMVFAVKRPA